MQQKCRSNNPVFNHRPVLLRAIFTEVTENECSIRIQAEVWPTSINYPLLSHVFVTGLYRARSMFWQIVCERDVIQLSLMAGICRNCEVSYNEALFQIILSGSSDSPSSQ